MLSETIVPWKGTVPFLLTQKSGQSLEWGLRRPRGGIPVPPYTGWKCLLKDMPIMYPLDDTIVAVASPPGGAARGILRLSGPQAVGCAARFFRGADQPPLDAAAPRRVIAGRLELPGLHAPLPCEAYVWSGDSYTRQPVVEIHTIGSPPLLDLALRSFCEAGARLAGPGEFTLRAFLAGRIDLGQAEAVLGVIDAADRRDLDIALGQLAGGLASPLHRLRDALLDMLAEVEAGLDFPDENISFLTPEQLGERLRDARRQIDELLGQMSGRGATGAGACVILVGRPNAGKSSLLNALASNSAALVSEHAGTTRDYLVAELDLDGIKCQLIDTAGESAVVGSQPSVVSGDPPSPACGRGAGGEGGSRRNRDSAPRQPTIEQAAQAAAADQRRVADLELVCIDSTRTLEPGQLDQLRSCDGRRIVVVTKWDEKRKADFWRESPESHPSPQRKRGTANAVPSLARRASVSHSAPRTAASRIIRAKTEVCFVSSRTGAGLAELKGELRWRLMALRSARGEVMASTAARCQESLRIAGECLDRARNVAQAGREELAAAEIRVALEALDRVAGTVYTDDVLAQVFSRFCIGK